MMRRLLSVFSIILISTVLSARAQDEPVYQASDKMGHSGLDFSISASPNVVFNTPDGPVVAGGLKLRMFIGKRFILSPYIDYSAGYSGPVHGFACGISCGYYFPIK